MTGRNPDNTTVWNLDENWRVKHQDWTSLPGMFKDSGIYKSLGSGKTYHDTVQNGIEDAIFEYDSHRSWSPESLPYRNPCWTQGIDCAGCPDDGGRWKINNVSANFCVHTVGDLADVLTTNHAIDLLDNVIVPTMNEDKEGEQPFYLAVGYHKPHMPWIAKQEFFDLYPLEDIPLPKVQSLPDGIPFIAYNDNSMVSFRSVVVW